MPDPDAPKKKSIATPKPSTKLPESTQRAIDWAGDPNAFLPINPAQSARAEAAAAAVPASVDQYQKTVEAARVMPPSLPITPAPVPEPPSPPPLVATPTITPENPRNGISVVQKTAADSAAELAATPKNRVDDVINKLKEEEKKGGPNLFEILEAAAAGWQGKTPLYVEKKMQKAAQEADAEKEAKRQEFEREQMAEQARLQNEELTRRFAEERALREQETALAREELAKEIASREKIAAMSSGKPLAVAGVGKVGPLDLAELGVGR